MDIVNNIIELHNGTALTFEDIENTILAVADKHFADGANIYTVNQSRFQAVLIETGCILFKNGALRDPTKQNNSQYDKVLVEQLGDIFIYICQKYSKMVTMAGFGFFCNIPYETMKDWQIGENLSREAIHTKEKLIEGQGRSIINKLYDSNNVTGQAMLANNLLGWSTSRAESTTTHKIESISTLGDDYNALEMK